MKTLRGWAFFAFLYFSVADACTAILSLINQWDSASFTRRRRINCWSILNTPDTRLKNPDIQAIIQLSLSKTAGQLYFTAAKNDNDPNLLMYSKSANCIGYAAFFTTACNYFLKKNGLDAEWTVSPRIGQLYLLETNVHHWFRSPFFKDHDFVVLENRTTGAVWAVDPTVYDYGRIVLVTRR